MELFAVAREAAAALCRGDDDDDRQEVRGKTVVVVWAAAVTCDIIPLRGGAYIYILYIYICGAVFCSIECRTKKKLVRLDFGGSGVDFSGG